jgi:hypothetical protein
LMRLAWLKTRPDIQVDEMNHQTSSVDAPNSETPRNSGSNTSSAVEQVPALQAQDDSIFDFDADIHLDSFDMLGQFENGMSSFWPSWNVDTMS